MLSFFGLGKSKAQIEKPNKAKGIIGRYYEGDLPVIVKLINELPESKVMSELTFLTIVSWKYDGSKNNGMPSTEINNRMIILEDAIENSMNFTDLFTHVYSRTGNNLKEFAYYSKNQNLFMEILNGTLKKHDAYPIEINFYEDKEWIDFKTVLKDFEK
ncbi:DUF695 domain-containing protein [Aggregatimonas sangjinii]|uniref:DUF695 domain-containing protein n=1 Tax=Aggregatimonas sangjinii TaxID=2583587 RepID=A0A5B7SYL7_9FLAO|nr:DUF695 domain-containing protein [Aggregatimonas sangjinii]QCX02168.1 DUF695 domain-containing protein [Aggregatimonas sangjinii]